MESLRTKTSPFHNVDFIGDFWKYCSCYEIPRNYAFWSAISLLGATVHRKVYFLHGDIEIYANIYVLLVGPVGNGKTTCCSFARQLFTISCPDLEIGASTQSAEDIVVQMSKAEFVRCFTNERGETVEVRPYAFFINEFKDFIAYAPVRMLNFLGNIYDQKAFKASTIKRGVEDIINPSLNILGCENPDQLVKLMKNDVVTGGMSRRVVLVYETKYQEPKAIPTIDPEARAAWNRVSQRLTDVRSIVGCFKWSEGGRKFYKPWYDAKQNALSANSNVIMQGYQSTKHVQLFKVCMLIDACSDKPMFLFTDELLQHGLAFLDALEYNMPRLSMAAGRNEMIGPQRKILDMLESAGGYLGEKEIMRRIETEMTPMETSMSLRHLEESEQVIRKRFKIPNSEGKLIERLLVILPKKYFDMKEKGEIV